MSAISLHEVDDRLSNRIRELARNEGTSINKTVQKLLRQATGLSTEPIDRRSDFTDIFGTWTREDVAEFEQAIADLGEIVAEDWK